MPLLLMIMIEWPLCSLAQSPSPTASAVITTSSAPPNNIFTAFLSRDVAAEPANSFTTATPKIYLRWEAETLPVGTHIRCIWIAESVGEMAPPNYHVDESTTTTNEPQPAGTFTLSKPKKGWPEGKYRVEIYVGTQLVETVPFTIEKLRGD